MMIHPATAHFAMVLPVVASTFGVIYLLKKNAMIGKITDISLLIAALAVIGVWYTGSQAGPQVYDYLSSAGKHELVEHKELGLYLAIAFAILAGLKLVGTKLKNFTIEMVTILLLLVATVMIFVQGKHGGEIVYDHGMPFKAYMIQDALHDASSEAEDAESDEDRVEIFQDAIDDIESMSEEINKLYGENEKDEEEEKE